LVHDLHHKGILITREERQANVFAEKVRYYRGESYIAPLLKIHCMTSEEHLKIFDNMAQYEWIFFTSANGVHCFFERWKSHFGDKQIPQNIAVVGTKTND